MVWSPGAAAIREVSGGEARGTDGESASSPATPHTHPLEGPLLEHTLEGRATLQHWQDEEALQIC